MRETLVSSMINTVAEFGDRVALKEGHQGATFSYKDYLMRAEALAGGLREAGMSRGDRVLVMMRNRPEFHFIDLGVMIAGGVPVSVYNSSSVVEIDYIANNCGASFVMLENMEFFRKWSQCSYSREVGVYVLDASDAEEAETLDSLFSAGSLDASQEASLIMRDDVATIIYTSGTTGYPKGVTLSHGNIADTVDQLIEVTGMRATPERRTVSYLPMAHIAERMMSHYQPMVLGYSVLCCKDASELPEALRESRPNILFGVPRVWEKIKRSVETAVAQDPERERSLREAVAAAISIRRRGRTGSLSQEDESTMEFLDAVAFKTLRETVGLDALEFAVSGAAALPVDVLEWFDAVGVPISEIYGMSESSGPMTWSPLGNKPGMVGRVLPGGEIKIDTDGEILYRGPNVFIGYWGDPEGTEETLRGGWLRSGDIGEVDEEGYLRIVDRKKDLIITSGGKNISPSNLEASLRGVPLVGQAAVVGEGRPYCTVLLSLDPDEVAVWADRIGLSALSFSDLTQSPEVTREIQRGIDSVNSDVAKVSWIRKFAIVQDVWAPGDDCMTPTSKIKRREVYKKYAHLIEDMYAGG